MIVLKMYEVGRRLALNQRFRGKWKRNPLSDG